MVCFCHVNANAQTSHLRSFPGLLSGALGPRPAAPAQRWSTGSGWPSSTTSCPAFFGRVRTSTPLGEVGGDGLRFANQKKGEADPPPASAQPKPQRCPPIPMCSAIQVRASAGAGAGDPWVGRWTPQAFSEPWFFCMRWGGLILQLLLTNESHLHNHHWP